MTTAVKKMAGDSDTFVTRNPVLSERRTFERNGLSADGRLGQGRRRRRRLRRRRRRRRRSDYIEFFRIVINPNCIVKYLKYCTNRVFIR